MFGKEAKGGLVWREELGYLMRAAAEGGSERI